MALTYSSYLKVNELLSLQQPASDPAEHDETLFIIIHQAYELWFKEILHELDHMVSLMDSGDLGRAGHTLKRVRTIVKVLVSQMDILETMTPQEFLSFRDRLGSASGFQSAQFRALEFTMGHKQPHVMSVFSEPSLQREDLERRMAAPTLWDVFLRYLSKNGYPVPEEQLSRDVTVPISSNLEMQQILRKIYTENHTLADFCELMTDLDEGVQEWRYRHVKMVERTIGSLPGTGGSAGVDYLKSTLFKPAFPDLWEFRAEAG
jgi:tryptophan 2,3-dioxygenase